MDGWQMVLRLAVAAFAGLVIGLERERREKAAGLRTLALVSSGAALFVMTAVVAAPAESIRMAAGVATGVGFLGAGSILRDRGEVQGLTTAATVWMAAALGIASATGSYTLVAAGVVLTLLVLTALGRLDLARFRQDARVYELTYRADAWEHANASECLTQAGLSADFLGMTSSGESLLAEWRAVGRQGDHDRAMECLRASHDVLSFTVRS